MWVTGYGKTERALFTNNKAISYSGKRPIGINGINIPIARADTLSRVFLLDVEKHPVGKSQSEVITNIKQLMPEILGHIFDILVIALKTYDEIRTKIKPNHKLGEFVIWGEVISRALGNNDNEFLKAWELNVKNQNQACGDSNTFIQLMIGFIYEQQNEIKLEPSDSAQRAKIIRYQSRP